MNEIRPEIFEKAAYLLCVSHQNLSCFALKKAGYNFSEYAFWRKCHLPYMGAYAWFGNNNQSNTDLRCTLLLEMALSLRNHGY